MYIYSTLNAAVVRSSGCLVGSGMTSLFFNWNALSRTIFGRQAQNKLSCRFVCPASIQIVVCYVVCVCLVSLYFCTHRAHTIFVVGLFSGLARNWILRSDMAVANITEQNAQKKIAINHDVVLEVFFLIFFLASIVWLLFCIVFGIRGLVDLAKVSRIFCFFFRVFRLLNGAIWAEKQQIHFSIRRHTGESTPIHGQ